MKFDVRKIFLAVAMSAFLLGEAHVPVVVAAPVDEVTVKPRPGGYDIILQFPMRMRYQRHTLSASQKILRVQLRPVSSAPFTAEEIDRNRVRTSLAWDRSSGIPLQEITYDGKDPLQPELTLLFTKEIAVQVNNGLDLLSLVISVSVPEAATILPTPEPVPPGSAREDQTLTLMSEAKDAMRQGDNSRAVQLYTKARETGSGEVRQQAQELLGVAREQNKQFAHAKAEYEKYLAEYPTGPDADRVRQRLAGLLVLAQAPTGRTQTAAGIRKSGEKTPWRAQSYGTFSQFYVRDETVPERGAASLNRADVTTDADVNSRWENGVFDIRTKLTGAYENTFVDGTDNEYRLSSMYIEVKNMPQTWSGKFGRQSRTTGGVLGRFDGAHVSYGDPAMTLHGVFGAPVASVRQTRIDPDRRFYGVSTDWSGVRDAWDVSAYAIQQENNGLIDRRALGSELRYQDEEKSLFNTIDYDIFYGQLNFFLLNGSWKVSSDRTLTLVCDQRRSPLLTTGNAIVGQGVDRAADLLARFSEDDIYQLAEDRTALSKVLTLGITQDLPRDLQLGADITISEVTGTDSSGGVAAVEGTGTEYYLTTQLTKSNLFRENDSVTASVRYGDLYNSRMYALLLNCRLPYKRDFRFMPKVQLDYRDEKSTSDYRWSIRPALLAEYRLSTWLRFEMEAGMSWTEDVVAGTSLDSTETYLSAGYRVYF